MELEEYQEQVKTRYEDLTDDEKDIIKSFIGTPASRVIGKIVGPELSGLVTLGSPTRIPRKRGLATR